MFRRVSKKEAAARRSSKMESRDHSNAAIPKSLMSRGNLLQRAFLLFAVFWVSTASAFAQDVKKDEWSILCVVFTNVQTCVSNTISDTRFDEIRNSYIDEFEKFVENAVPSLDLKITVVRHNNFVNASIYLEGNYTLPWNFEILSILNGYDYLSYDGVIAVADLTATDCGVDVGRAWWPQLYSTVMILPQTPNHNNVHYFYHEWMHQLELWFKSLGYTVPGLDNDWEKYGYDNVHEQGWYRDYLSNTLKGGTVTGIHSDWWKQSPTKLREWQIGSPIQSNVIATYNNGTLVISGTEAMKDWGRFDNTLPWYCVKNKLTSVVINDNVTNIGNYAFHNTNDFISNNLDCISLSSVYIPNSVIKIGESAFRGCNSLSEIHISNLIPPDVGDWCFDGVNQAACKLYVPAGTENLYATTPVWKDFKIVEQSSSGTCTIPPSFDSSFPTPTTGWERGSFSIASNGCLVYRVEVTSGAKYEFNVRPQLNVIEYLYDHSGVLIAQSTPLGNAQNITYTFDYTDYAYVVVQFKDESSGVCDYEYRMLPTYTINASAESGGSIEPSGTVTVIENNSQSFGITPEPGFKINEVWVDGSYVGENSSFTFPNVTGNHTIHVTFSEIWSYDPFAVATINRLIANNGLNAVLDDPKSWAFAIWDDATPKQLTKLNLNYKNLTGTASFAGLTALQSLDCAANNLSALDVSNCTQLKDLLCNNNILTSLEVSNCSQLQNLICSNNSLTALDVTNCTQLIVLECFKNDLSELVVTNCTQLQDLHCGSNNLTELDVANCSQLKWMTCEQNRLMAIDVSHCTQLQQFWCEINSLTTLDLTGLNGLADFRGHSQAVTLTLSGAAGEYKHSISLNSPTFDQSAISYAGGALKSTDNTVISTGFSVQTNKSGFDLSGTLKLSYFTSTPSMTWYIGHPNAESIIATLYDDGTFTITGTGAMIDWGWGGNGELPPWYDIRDNFTNIIVGDGITTIGFYAFIDLSNVVSVRIGKDVNIIKGTSFWGCLSLIEIYCNNPIPPIVDSDDVFWNVDRNMCKLYVPDGTQHAYATDIEWQHFNIVKIQQEDPCKTPPKYDVDMPIPTKEWQSSTVNVASNACHNLRAEGKYATVYGNRRRYW